MSAKDLHLHSNCCNSGRLTTGRAVNFSDKGGRAAASSAAIDQALSKEEKLAHMRHSCAHMLAQAVLEMFPEAKLAIGPTIDTGFYYDFELPRTLIPEDLALLQEKMERIAKEKQTFHRNEEPIDKAIEFLRGKGQPYKVEIAEDLAKEGEKTVSFYENRLPSGEMKFWDLCRGGHTENTRQTGAFKLNKIAGAYWRGDSERPMLQRIYGLCFETKDELKAYEKMEEEAKKRDHRKLGEDLRIFTFSEKIGAGLPLWLPNGAIIIEELEKLAKETEFKAGYDRVRTPLITKEDLFHQSGHLPYYKDSMYSPIDIDGENFYLKPMNCPFHHMCYAAHPKSYRELPVRYAEYGTCHRYEDSGSLFGLMRVRAMQMNDAHIYCTEEQFEAEFLAVVNMYLDYFKLFGIEKYVMRLSLHSKAGLGKKYVDEPELWLKTEDMVRSVMKKSGVPTVEVEDEAAFYGPKIDVQVWSAIGREFTLATNQIDFAVPKRFNLTYIDSDGKEKTPLCIHRAPLSTHERFIGFLIEHYAGAFPTWMAPVQVQILPVADPHVAFAEKLRAELAEHNVRVKIDNSGDSLGKRIRAAEMMKVPYMLVIGDKEVEGAELAVRSYKTKEQKNWKKAEFVKEVLNEIMERKL
ncbi:threonine--tRNA ligase [Candidatus Peregrinibacteria bacterium]|nr:threonine--tRNA ligase [Candidatus Peregrinibacteria bacterium]